MATAKNQYSPDAIIPTEQVLKGYLEDMGLSQHDLAEKCGYSTDSINKIISGETRIEPGIATRLEQALGLKPTSGLESSKSTKIHWRTARHPGQ